MPSFPDACIYYLAHGISGIILPSWPVAPLQGHWTSLPPPTSVQRPLPFCRYARTWLSCQGLPRHLASL